MLLALALVIPALFIHLGLLPVQADEPTRANVAMEMMYSGNYLVSTINGEYYYKKPPVFNWLLAGVYQLSGSKGEFVSRLTAVIPLLLFAMSIFIRVRKYLGPSVAGVAAMFFITFGRMLFYDSFLAHIDILYSWITFESFLYIYACYANRSWGKLFAVFYLLQAFGFMLKGLPSILFTSLTLLALAAAKKDLRFLFTWQHLLGMVLGIAGPLCFFYTYAEQNSLNGWIEHLWDQSKQRTVLDKTWFESVRHLFTFPLDHLIHLAPWSLLLVFVCTKSYFRRVKEDQFLKYLFFVLAFNIPVYWASPGYYPRYLFMIYPIAFVFLADSYLSFFLHFSRLNKWLEIVWLCLIALVVLAFPIAVYKADFPIFHWHFGLMCAGFILILVLYWLFTYSRLWTMIAFVLLLRVGFNLYVMPQRVASGEREKFRKSALHIAAITKNKPLYISYPYTPLNHDYTYYLERERGEILRYKEPDTTSLFLFHPLSVLHTRYQTIYEFPIEYDHTILKLVKFTYLPPHAVYRFQGPGYVKDLTLQQGRAKSLMQLK